MLAVILITVVCILGGAVAKAQEQPEPRRLLLRKQPFSSFSQRTAQPDERKREGERDTLETYDHGMLDEWIKANRNLPLSMPSQIYSYSLSMSSSHSLSMSYFYSYSYSLPSVPTPTPSPTHMDYPSPVESRAPSKSSEIPTSISTKKPSPSPPTKAPSTDMPTGTPTSAPSKDPIAVGPTATPTALPMKSPTTSAPSPTNVPTQASTSDNQSTVPSRTHSSTPTETPTHRMMDTERPSEAGPRWEMTNTLSASRAAVGFGRALAMTGTMLVAGSPYDEACSGSGCATMKPGSVLTYSRVSTENEFSVESELFGFQNSMQFGAAVDMRQNYESSTIDMAIGAPRTGGMLVDFVTFGAVYVSRWDGNEEWRALGGPIRSTERLEEAGGEFGASVALAVKVNRIAVGAPSRSLNINNFDTGGVTVFELQNDVWTAMPSTPLFGPAGSYFGKSIDLSDDGNSLLVGAPGPSGGNYPGRVNFFKWNGVAQWWRSVYTDFGTGSQALGSAVAIINDAGTQIAYGVPGSNNNRGAVRVVEQNDRSFVQIGSNIFGKEVGEMVGMVLCGKNSRIAIGTQTGILRIYDYNGSSWVPFLNSPDVGVPIVTCSMSDDSLSVAVGLANELVQVFDLIA